MASESRPPLRTPQAVTLVRVLQVKTWPVSGVVAVGYLGCKALDVGAVVQPAEAFADGVQKGKS